jgi:hypothetical protein
MPVFFLPKLLLKIAWRLVKKYGLWAILLIYLFRATLFSGPVCRLLEKKIEASSGCKVKIARFGGSYFTSVSLHGIELSEAKGAMRKLKVASISVSYNLLGPLFGERLLLDISCKNPEIEIVSTGEAQEPPAARKKINFAGVDFLAILRNAPNLNLLGADVAYSDEKSGKKISLNNFTLQSRRRGGTLTCDKIALAALLSADDNKEITHLSVAWSLKNKLLTIDSVALALTGYAQPIALHEPLQLDLSVKHARLRKLTLPLPNGALVHGTLDAHNGCHLELDALRLDFERDVRPWCELLALPVKSCDVAATTGFHLDLPQWDITRLAGHLLLRIERASRPPLPPITSGDKVPGFAADCRIEDLAEVEELLHALGLVPHTGNVAGKLELRGSLQLPDTSQVRCRGQMRSDNLTTKVLGVTTPLACEWQVNSDTEGRLVKVAQFMLQLAALKLSLQGELKRGTGLSARAHGSMQAATLHDLVPQLQNLGDASFDTQWQVATDVADPAARPLSFNATGEQTMQIALLKLLQYQFRDIVIRHKMAATATSAAVSDLSVAWRNARLTASANAGLKPGEPFALRAAVTLPGIENYIGDYLPAYAKLAIGDLAMEIELSGRLPQPGELPDVTANVCVRLKNGIVCRTDGTPLARGDFAIIMELQSRSVKIGEVPPLTVKLRAEVKNGSALDHPLPPLAVELEAASGHEVVALQALRIFWQNERLLACHGNVAYRPGARTDIACEFDVKNLAEKLSGLVVLPSGFVLPAHIQGNIRLCGTVDAILAGKASGECQGELFLRQGRLPQLAYEQIGIHWETQGDLHGMRLAKFAVKLDDKAEFACHGSLGYDKLLTPDFQGSIAVAALEKLLPQAEVSGRIQSKFLVRGKLPPAPLDLRDITLETKLSLMAEGGQVKNIPYAPTRLLADVVMEGETVICRRLRLTYAGQEVLQAQGKFTNKTGKSDFQCDVALPQFHKLLPAQLCAQLPATGDLKMSCRFSGVPPQLRADGRLGADLTLALDNGSLAGKPCRSVRISLLAEAEARAITVKKLCCEYDRLTLAEVSGRVGYTPDIALDLLLRSPLTPLVREATSGMKELTWQVGCDSSCKLTGQISPQHKTLAAKLLFTLPLLNHEKTGGWRIAWQDIVVEGRNAGKTPDGFTLEAQVTGTFAKPDGEALLSLSLPKIKLEQQDITARDVAVAVKFAPQAISFKADAILGGAPLVCKGEVSLRDYFPQSLNLSVQGKRLLLVRTDDMYGRADIALTLTGKVERTAQGQPKFVGKLAGEIVVTEFIVKTGMSLDRSGERVIVTPRFESPFLDLELDVRINLVKIIVSNNLAKIEIGGNLHIGGDLAEIEPRGRLATKSGKLFLPQGVMNITECLVELKATDPFMPYFEVRAETRVREYQIFVVIQGKQSDFTIEFFSLPPLNKEDVLLLLLTGATQAELSQSAGEKLKETGSFILLQQLLNYVGVGDYVAAQVTEESAAITVTPPEWKGFAVQGKVTQGGKMRFNFIYKIEFK